MYCLLDTAQGGIPVSVWIIVGIIAAIIGFVLAVKSFWVSKGISILLSIGGIVISIMGLLNVEQTFFYTLIGGAVFGFAYLFLAGNMVFDSETEGTYLVRGSLVHDTNHPFKAFSWYMGGIAALTFFIFWAAYAWTFIIALVAFILTILLNVGLIIEHIRG